jgi:hypothetical protein
MVEQLPSNLEALSSNSSIVKNKTKTKVGLGPVGTKNPRTVFQYKVVRARESTEDESSVFPGRVTFEVSLEL